MCTEKPVRPELSSELGEEEFLRWYWLKDELVDFARGVGARTTGNKDLLTSRIAATLGGRSFQEPAPTGKGRGHQLQGELSHETIIPAGQRCSQLIRAWMTSQVGSTFHFDVAMREFFFNSDGTRTMREAVEHWYLTRGDTIKSIDAQFEYNRFTRSWYQAHSHGTREALLAAWEDYRDTPVDQRGRV